MLLLVVLLILVYSIDTTATTTANENHNNNLVHVINLYGGITSIGEYYMLVNIGKEQDKFRLQVDTGSSSLVISSVDCKSCIHNEVVVNNKNSQFYSNFRDIDQALDLYDIDRETKLYNGKLEKIIKCNDAKHCDANSCDSLQCFSASFGEDVICSKESNACCSNTNPEACGFYLRYGGDTKYKVTAEGVLAKESISFNDQHKDHIYKDQTIYVTLKESGPWPTQVDGIFGLGYNILNCNPTCSKPVYETILNEQDAKFTICIGNLGGTLVFNSDGKTENLIDNHPKNEIQYVPIIQTSHNLKAYYTVNIENIILVNPDLVSNKYSLINNKNNHLYTLHDKMVMNQGILDTGTTLLLLNENVFKHFKQVLQSKYCHVPGICGSKQSIFKEGVCLIEEIDFSQLPILIIELQNHVNLLIPPELYIIPFSIDDSKTVYCLGIGSSGNGASILGDVLLRGYTTIFDRTNSQIGFALPNRTNCGTKVSPVKSKEIIELTQKYLATSSPSNYFLINNYAAYYSNLIIGIISIIAAIYYTIKINQF